MLLFGEKGNRGRICHSIYRYAKANKKYMNDYDKNKEMSYLYNSGMEIVYIVGQCCKSFQ